jgi:hypothetical protein
MSSRGPPLWTLSRTHPPFEVLPASACCLRIASRPHPRTGFVLRRLGACRPLRPSRHPARLRLGRGCDCTAGQPRSMLQKVSHRDTYTSMHRSLLTWMNTCMNRSLHTCMNTGMDTCMNARMNTCTCAQTHKRMHLYTCTHALAHHGHRGSSQMCMHTRHTQRRWTRCSLLVAGWGVRGAQQ